MKYVQSNMSLRGVLPSSVQDWLDHELEMRGIDAVIYTRYILMILQDDSSDDHSESELFNSNHIRPARYSSHCKQEKKKTSIIDSEERKKNAAVECLMSVSEQKNGIENLVEELCLKLKNIQSQKEQLPNCDSLIAEHSEGSDCAFSTSEELAQKYYAAFPALKTSVETIAAASISNASVWCSKNITNRLSPSLQEKLKNDLVSSESKEINGCRDSKSSLSKRHNASRYSCSGSCIKRVSNSRFSSLERLGISNKTLGSKTRLLRPTQRSRTRTKDSSYKSENVQERLQGIKKCGWLKDSTPYNMSSAPKKESAAFQMLKKDLLVRPPRRRVDKHTSGGHSKDANKKTIHGKVFNNLKEGLKNNFQESGDHLNITTKLSSSWDSSLPIISRNEKIIHFFNDANGSEFRKSNGFKRNHKNVNATSNDGKAQMSKNNYIFAKSKFDEDLEGLSEFSEKFTSDVAAIWENKMDSCIHFPYHYRSTYFSLTSLNDDDPLLENGEIIGKDLISGIQSFQFMKDFSNEKLSHLDSYLSSCKYSRSGLLDIDFDAGIPDISVFDSFYSKNCSFFGTKLWDENTKSEFDFSWHQQEMFIEGGVYGSISLPFEDDTWKATFLDLKFLKPKMEYPLFDDNDLKLFNFLDNNESLSANLNSVWDFEILKGNFSDKNSIKKLCSHANDLDKKSILTEVNIDDKKLNLKDDFGYHKEESCFVKVQQKISCFSSDSEEVESNVKAPVLVKEMENEEQENLLISQRTHFRPIREESLEETLSDATTTTTECSDEVPFDIIAGKPKFTKTDSGSLCIEEEGQSPKKYMLYHGNDIISAADNAFKPKFKMSNLEKFCQTEEYIAGEFDHIYEVEVAEEAENLLTDSLQNMAQVKKETADISSPIIPREESLMWECEIDVLPITLDLSQQSNEVINDNSVESESQDFLASELSLSWVSDTSLPSSQKWQYLDQYEDIVLLRDELKKEEDQLLNDINSLREIILTDNELNVDKIDLYQLKNENKTLRAPLTNKNDHINQCVSLPLTETNSSIDISKDILLQEKENVTRNLPFVPTDKIIYSSELEEFWQKDNQSFDVQIPKKRLKSKQVFGKKPCSFYLEGNCRRADCKFAHDLSTITCRFWEEGCCFKGITCPFLHGYSSNVECVEDLETIFSLDLDSEDFPALRKSKEHHHSIDSFPFFNESKKKKSGQCTLSTSDVCDNPHGNKLSKKLKGKEKSISYEIKLCQK